MTEKTFEENLNELEQVVNHLEQGDVPLEESLKLFQHGMKLSKNLKQTLHQAEKLLIKIIDEEGNEVERSLDEEE